jgi:hypothetical protein
MLLLLLLLLLLLSLILLLLLLMHIDKPADLLPESPASGRPCGPRVTHALPCPTMPCHALPADLLLPVLPRVRPAM